MPFWRSAPPISQIPPGCPDARRVKPLGAGIVVSWALGAFALGLASLPARAWLPAAEQAAIDQAAAEQAGEHGSGAELVLDRRQRQLMLLEQGVVVARFPVAVGRPGWETPVGQFRVIELVVDPIWVHPVTGLAVAPGADNPLGSRWIGFYRDCQPRRGFNADQRRQTQGCVTAGFHGTPNRSSIGRAVSHGCVRLLDEDVRELFERVQLGTPVTVLP